MKAIKNISIVLIAMVTLAFTSVHLLDSNGSCAIPESDLEQLPEFEIDLLDSGKTFDSSDLNGKYTLVDVWSPSCGVCVDEVPALQELHQSYSNKNFQVVSIALSNKDRVKKFRSEKYPMPWKHAVAEKSLDGEIVQLLDVKSTPTYYLVSPEGEILATRKDFKEAGSFTAVVDQYFDQ